MKETVATINDQTRELAAAKQSQNGSLTIDDIDHEAMDIVTAIRSLIESGFTPIEYHSSSKALVLAGPNTTQTTLQNVPAHVMEFLTTA